MRLVLDTNTALSGLLWAGKPGRLLDAAQDGEIMLVSSRPLLAELEVVLARAKFAKRFAKIGFLPADLLEAYSRLVAIVTPATIPPTILCDPADDKVLATAVAAKADMIVSGDAHLLDLVHFQSIAIVSAADAVARLP